MPGRGGLLYWSMITKDTPPTKLAAAWNPEKGPLSTLAWQAIVAVLADGELWSWNQLVERGVAASGLTSQRVSNLLTAGVGYGYLAKTGPVDFDKRLVMFTPAGRARWVEGQYKVTDDGA